MPEWMHNRAEHILAKNPSMPKGEAFAIATQQMHALGKSPKGYGTSEGKATAKAKYDTPKDDKKTANPGGLESPKMEKKALTLAELGALSVIPTAAAGGVGGYRKGGLSGAARGAIGASAGGLLGGAAGALTPAGGSAVPALAGIPLGALAGYKALTHGVEKKAHHAALLDEFSKLAGENKILFSKVPESDPEKGMKSQSMPAELPLLKASFQVSQYSGPLSMGPFKMTSGLPNKPPPSLYESPTAPKMAGAMTPSGLTPAARLSSSQTIGQPKVTAPSGPSIADVAKPKGPGTGFAIPGAKKTLI